MSEVRMTFTEMLAQIEKYQKKSYPATASFYPNDNHTCILRIESIELMKEFVNGESDDNFGQGRDLKGHLFYQTALDFDCSEDVIYKAQYDHASPRAIKVDFYSDEGDSASFATFIARDEVQNLLFSLSESLFTSAKTGIAVDRLQHGSGQWRNLKIVVSCGEVSKVSTGAGVILKVEPIGKKVTFDVNGTASGNLAARYQGAFYFRKLAELTGNDCVVDYNEDRIVFYHSNNKGKIVAVFIPVGGTGLGIPKDGDLDLPTATWGNI